MKVNGAPEKLYVSVGDAILDIYSKKESNEEIEYTRTDVLIETVEKYLKSQFIKDVSVLAGGAVNINFSVAIENFLKYMKG